MIPLDGNAIAGDLAEVFGADLTTATGVCAACGASAFLAEAVVYMRGPGGSRVAGRAARCCSCS